MTSDINDICKLSRLGQFKMFNCLEMVKVNTSVIFFRMYLQSIRSHLIILHLYFSSQDS